ncbi:HAD family hydrolase [Howardella ureilytica]
MEIMNAVIVVLVGIAIFIVAAILNKNNQNYYKLIVFDLDGTLIDSGGDLADALNATLDKNGFTTVKREEIIPLLGNGTRKLISDVLPENASDEIKEKCYKEFLEYYKEHDTEKTITYPGIKVLLGYLKNKKRYKLAVITNKDDAIAKDIVNKLMPNKFDYVIGSNAGFRNKPVPDALLYLSKKMKVKSHLMVYVGDSEVDYKFALNGNVNVIMASWGYRDKDFLRQLGNRVNIIDFPGELHDLL